MSQVSALSVVLDQPHNSLQKLIERSGKAVAKTGRSTVAARKAQLLADLEGFDIDRLLEIKEQMSAFIDLITTSLGEDVVLGDEHAETLMQQALGVRDIAEFLDVCKDRIKEIVFDHITAVHQGKGEKDPENINGSIEVSSLGMKLCREAAGHSAPSINPVLLKKALGDRWSEVVEEKIIPAKKVQEVNADKLWGLVQEDPTLMETIRDCLDPGAPKNARLNLRPIS